MTKKTHRRPHEVYDDLLDKAEIQRQKVVINTKYIAAHMQAYLDLHCPNWKIWDVVSPRTRFYTPTMVYHIETVLVPLLEQSQGSIAHFKSIIEEIKVKYPGIHFAVLQRLEIEALAFEKSTKGAILYWKRLHRKGAKSVNRRKIK